MKRTGLSALLGAMLFWLVVILLFALLNSAACAGNGAPRVDLERLRLGGGFQVTAIGMWSSRAQVPRRYQHTVDMHAWSGPVGYVMAGDYVCTNLTDAEWALVNLGDRPGSCRWRPPRGV